MAPSDRPAFDAKGKRIGIFIIAYNAESHIAETIARIPADVWSAIEVAYIVDDCSTDETVATSLELANRYEKLTVIRNRVNRRYGGNQKFGYQYALDRGLDIVVMLHADGQYAPECLAGMLEPLVGAEAEVTFGSRMSERGRALKGGMPLYKYVGNIVLTSIQNRLCALDLSEFHSGYRAYATSFLRRIPFWENTDEWHFDTEILIQARESKARVVEVAIPTYYGNEICHVNGIAYGIECILLSLRYWMYRTGIFYSRSFDVADLNQVKYGEKFHDPYSSHSQILAWLDENGVTGKKVLEVGTGDASLTRRLAQRGVLLDAIELDAASVALARPYCRRVYEGNLERMEELPVEDTYDVILAADVLEHIRNAEFVLSRFKHLLRKGGTLIVSVPNFVNIYVRLNVLLGRFRYHRKGILDETHVKFYTDETARMMLRRTGWKIERHLVTSIPLVLVFPFLTGRLFRWVLVVGHVVTRIWKSMFAYQNMYICTNPNQGDLL